jgi:uncharacterized membrane protein
MERTFYQDLLLVVFITILSLVILVIPAINLFPLSQPITYIPYILLLLFLPGYSLLAAENPLFIQNSLIKRLGLSVVVSMIISVLVALLLTFTPLKIFNSTMIYIIGAFTLILSFIALLKRRNYHFVHYIEPEEQKPSQKELEIEKVEANEDMEIEKLESAGLTNNNTVVSDLKTEKVDKKEIKPKTPSKEEIKPNTSNNEEINPNTSEKTEIKPESTRITDELKDHQHQTREKISVLANQNRPIKEQTKENKPKPSSKEISQSVNNSGIISPKPKSSSGFAYYDLVLVLILTILSLSMLLWPILRNPIVDGVMGFLLMLFLPGYALVAVFYPGWKDLEGIKRIVFSFGISYFLTAVIGLILNYTSLGSNLNSILLGLSVLSLIFLALAFLSRIRMESGKRFRLDYSLRRAGLPGGSRSFMGLAVILIAVLFVATPAYNLITPAKEPVRNYTEFYVMSVDGNNITSYPTNLTSGENGTVNMVLVNHEQKNTTYHIITTSNGTVMDEIDVTLQPDEKKVIPYNFTAGTPATKKLEFRLYKQPDLSKIYLTCSFWLTINELLEETVVEETTTDTTDAGETTDETADDG